MSSHQETSQETLCPFHKLTQKLASLSVNKSNGMGRFDVFGDILAEQQIVDMCDKIKDQNFSNLPIAIHSFEPLSARGEAIVAYIARELGVSEGMKEGFFVPAFKTLETLLIPGIEYIGKIGGDPQEYIRTNIIPTFQNYKIFHPDIERNILMMYPHATDQILSRSEEWKLCPAFPYMKEIISAVAPLYL